MDLEFEINTDYIPENFLRGEVKVDERRHLVFATNHMLTIGAYLIRQCVQITMLKVGTCE